MKTLIASSFKKFPGILLCLLACALLFLLLATAFRSCSDGKKVDFRKIENLSYVPGSSNPYQTLDLYLPAVEHKAPLPLIVWIHGGAWMSGDKNHPPASIVLARDYALASLNYRLTGEAAHPAQIHDCKAALRFLRANAEKYGIDPRRIAVWGHSAGAHLAALLGSSGDVKELEGDLGNNEYSSRVQSVAEWAGPSDLLTIADQAPANCKIDFKAANNPVAVFLGPAAKTEDYINASPLHYLSKDDPPFLILHARDDDLVPVAQAEELCAGLKKLGLKSTCLIIPAGGHGLGSSVFAAETMDFFDKNLK